MSGKRPPPYGRRLIRRLRNAGARSWWRGGSRLAGFTEERTSRSSAARTDRDSKPSRKRTAALLPSKPKDQVVGPDALLQQVERQRRGILAQTTLAPHLSVSRRERAFVPTRPPRRLRRPRGRGPRLYSRVANVAPTDSGDSPDASRSPNSVRKRASASVEMVDDADFTNSPSSLNLARTHRDSTPHSLASSCTRVRITHEVYVKSRPLKPSCGRL